MMDVEKFREFCLSLGDVEEKMPFGKFAARYDSLLVFYVSGHMFCMCDVDDFSYVDVRSTPSEIEKLKSRYAAVSGPGNPAMKFWVEIKLQSDMPAAEILTRVRRGYDIIREKYSKNA